MDNPTPPTATYLILPEDFERQLMRKLVGRLLSHLDDPAYEMPAAEMTLIAKLCADNSIGFAAVRRGDFGETARAAAEEFPFDAEGRVVPLRPAATPLRSASV